MEKSDVFLGGDGRIGVCRVNAYDAIHAFITNS